MTTLHWSVRAAILLALLCYVAAWPFLIMAAGSTLAHPEHGVRVALTFTMQAVAALAGVIGSFFLHSRRWFWWIAGSIALWLPTTFYLANFGNLNVR